jgi:Siphovirus ReqiPepy6 Gp37-like protein
MPGYTTPEFEFLLRHPRTLELVGELHPRDVTATWTRRDIDAGGFRVVVPREQASLDAVALHNVLEIRRDARDGLGLQTEFVGVIDARDVDEFGRMWTLEGTDLLGFWLSKRVVGATTASAKSGPAETVLKAYVSENLGPAAAATRRAASELVGLSWTVATSEGTGNDVDFRAVRANLLSEVTIPLCRLGDLTQRVDLLPDGAGYEYRTALPRDATVSSGALPFSLGWDNVEELGFREDFRGVANAVYVLGDGTGDTRNVTEVTLAPSITSHFRRETTLDARYANTVSLRTDAGETELERHDEVAVTVRGKPLRVSANARYRKDWDVGTTVTVAIPQIGVEVDRRIVAATVSLTRAAGEDVRFELGVYKSRSVLRRLVDRLRQLNVAASA